MPVANIDEIEQLEEDQEEQKNEPIDLSRLGDYPELDSQEMDYEADAFAISAPPPAGVYQFSVIVSERGVQIKKGQQGKQYYSVPLEFELISDDETLQGARVYQTFSTNIGRKRTSTLVTLLSKSGVSLPPGSISQRTQLEIFAKWLKSEPKIYLDVDWEASYKTTEKIQGKVVEVYKPVIKGYDKFPKNPDGTKQFRFLKKLPDGTLIEYGARLTIKTIVGKNKASSSGGTKKQVATKTLDASVEEMIGEL